MNILIPILFVCGVGLVAAGILTIASKVFFVPVDETFAKLRAELPGANCGACGYNGCDDYANAMAEDRSLSCSLCPVGGADVAAKLADVLGVEAGDSEKIVAFVRCNGNNDSTRKIMEYEGLKTCSAAKQFFGGLSACPHGCIGLRDCETACPYDSIHVINGVAKVNRETCVGCGICAGVCPNQVIRMQPAKNIVLVECKSIDKGGVARKACDNACIGCKKCESACKFDSIHVENNLADIDPVKCKNCGMCAKVCPTGAIHNLRVKKALPPKKPAAPKPAEETKAIEA